MEKDIKNILAIESSCDETSVAVVQNGEKILSNIVASQIKSHERFGGVVPEVASRHHVEQVSFCVSEALKEANVDYENIDAVAVTQGPGLVGALLIGVTAAKSIAMAHDLPLIPINHMAGHIYAANYVEKLEFPLLALLVSGGHTELVYMKDAYSFETIGETRDDAVGEAYDKVGRVLGLTYPSGKPIDELAHKGQDTYDLPRAMLKEDNFDFSLSGVKSAVINTVHNAAQKNEAIVPENLAASFQASVIDVLVAKSMRAIEKYQPKQFVIAGGVAANQGLRERMATEMKANGFDIPCIFPPLSLCGDNGAMIGAAAYAKINQEGLGKNDYAMNALPSLRF